MSWARFWNRFNPFIDMQRKQVLHHLKSPENFQKILNRERSRADRTGNELSLVVFAVENTNTASVLSQELVDVLTRRVRLTDEVGWFDDRSIGVVLPATPAEGAWKFADDICQKASATALHLDCMVYTYPSKWLPEEEEYYVKPQFPGDYHALDKAMFQGLPTNGNSAANGYATRVISFPSSKLRTSARPTEGLEPLFVLHLPIWKRCLDIMGAMTGLVISSPLIIAAAGAIKLTSQGPVIFKQERIGLSGKKFTFWKFRSMYVNSNSEIHRSYVEKLIKNGSPNDPTATQEHEKTYKITNDPRVTPVGKFLRKTSIDELPQLINVLKGEMSLVGPRPPIPYELWSYDIWHKRRVLDIKPGITGLWQVKGRSRTTFDEMVRLDLKYIGEWSLWLDIKILLQTPWAVFSSKGAY